MAKLRMIDQSEKHDRPHRRFNPLNGSWVLVSPQRSDRPWQGAQETQAQERTSRHDPSCYLCPGNTRISGDVNPIYSGPYVFQNDFPALLPGPKSDENAEQDPLFERQEVQGETRVICYSPRHDLGLSRLNLADIEAIIALWRSQYLELSSQYANVQIFENRGAAMGCSNPHPHGQIWSSDFIPTEVAREDSHQRIAYDKNKRPLLHEYALRECQDETRVVLKNSHWVCVVPYWASWPFEALVLPLENVSRLSDLNDDQARDLAKILKEITTKYDNLFSTEFPYSMGWHGAPTQNADFPHWTLHAHFYPPLLRSASIRKFMVGFELLGEVQRDLSPESAAQILRETSIIHFNDQIELRE